MPVDHSAQHSWRRVASHDAAPQAKDPADYDESKRLSGPQSADKWRPAPKETPEGASRSRTIKMFLLRPFLKM